MNKPTIEDLQAAADYHNAHAHLGDLAASLMDADLTTEKVVRASTTIRNMLAVIQLNAEAMIRVSDERSAADPCPDCEGSGLYLDPEDVFHVCKCRT